jgi:hypothetical protein
MPPSSGDAAALAMIGSLTHEPLAARPMLHIQGWAFDRDFASSLSVRTHAGQPADFTLKVPQRLDVFKSFNIPAASDPGFDIQTPCLTGCDLYIRSGPEPRGAEWVRLMSLDVPLTGAHLDKVPANLDAWEVTTDGATADQDFLSSRKWQLISGDHTLYGKIMPVLTMLALVYLAAALWLAFRRRAPWNPVLVCALVMGALLSRIGVLAIITATSFACNTLNRYVGPAYTILVMFVALAMVGIFTLWQPE